MSQTIRTLNASSELTKTWQSPATDRPAVVSGAVLETRGNLVVLAELRNGEHSPIPAPFTSIDDVIAEAENSPLLAEALNRARRRIAALAYVDEPLTIARLRMQQGLSQKQLAERIGTSQSHIARIETGTEDVRLKTLRKLASALDVSLQSVIDSLEESGNAHDR